MEPVARPTLADVAAVAGVSVSTASLAFSGSGPIAPATRERVLECATALGYTGPNPLGRSLRRGRAGIVGVVIGDQLRRAFRDPVSIQVLDGLAGALGAHGLGVLLVPHTDAEEDPLLDSAPIDVAVFPWGGAAEDPVVRRLLRRGVPLVVGEADAVDGAPAVTVHDDRGSADLARYLLGLGHRRVATITLPFNEDRRLGPVDAGRLATLRWASARRRLAGLRAGGVEPVAIVETPASLVEHGKSAAMILLTDPRPPTAIVAQSDLLASGAVLAARELGLRVGSDVSIAGFDGLDLPWLAPDRLTTVTQPLHGKGVALGEMAAGVVAGQRPGSITLDVKLSVGTTTGPPGDAVEA